MKMNAAFDLYRPMFGPIDVAKIAGVNRTMVDVWLQRGLISPAARGEKQNPRAKTKGKPYFSAREVFQVRLLHLLASDLFLGLSDYAVVAEKAKLASTISQAGEWMWAVARGIENGRPFLVYAYATHAGGEWQFDVHMEKTGGAPCFGWDVPHVYVPMSTIFSPVYLECKRLRVGDVDEGRDD
jgi:hypothetical protein